MVTCARCGEGNREGARFCSACAAPLAEPVVPAGVRKTVTVVFCDVTGSTALGERLDPEALRGILQRYFTELKTILERHGGTVEKFIGDAVMAVFGVPVLHEDDALRAVRAAAEMGDAIERLNAEASGEGAVALAVRTGVNTGEVLAGDPSSGHGFVTGDAVNVAARLEQAASPGEILIGDQTYALVRDAIRCEPVASLELKGKSEPIPAFRLMEVFPLALGHARRLDSQLIGREAELAQLQQAYASARDGRVCETLTVVGEAGVGKSRLVQEFLGRSAGEALVIQVRCLPYGEGITFWPVAEAVRAAAAINEDDSPESAREKVGALLGSVEDAPLIRERVFGAMGLAEAPGDIREMFWAIRRFFEALARDRPVILAVDDLQWGELTFLDLLQYVRSFTRDHALFLLGIARPELLQDRADWREGSALIHLAPLSEEQSDRMIAGLLGTEELPGELRARIVAAAQGTPLFVEEMVRKLLDDGLLSRDDGQWVVRSDMSGVVPLTIQALLGARLDRLDEEERVLLQRASVVGEEFWWGAVAELTPEDSRPAVGARLNTLLRKELIHPGTSSLGGEDAFRFSHLLVRDVAYESVPKALRADYHEVFTGWLERAVGERLPEYEEILGYHLERAFRFRAELGLYDDATRTLAARASGRLTEGGRRALARGDLKAAANLLERATVLMPPNDRAALLPDLAHAQRESGDLRSSEASLLEALLIAEETEDEAVATRARLDLARLRLMTGSRHDQAGALREAEAALEVFERLGDERGLAHAWYAIGQLRFWTGFSARAELAFQSSADHARQVGDEQLLADSLIWLCGALLWGPTTVPDTIRRLEDIRRESGAMIVQLELLNLLAVARAMQGHFQEARELLQQGASGMEEFGLRLELAAQGQFWAEVELLADNPESAVQRLGPGTEELRRMGEKGYLSTNAAWLAEANYRLGRFEEAEALTIESETTASPDDVESQYRWRGVRAKVLALRGSFKEARSLAEEAVSLALGTDSTNRHGDALTELAKVLRLGERPAEAVPFVKQAVALFEQKGNIVSAERARQLLVELESNDPG